MWPLVSPRPQIFKEPLCRRYYADVVSDAVLFRVIAYLGTIVLALVVAYATGGFWIKLSPDNVQGDVRYTQDALLIFEARRGRALGRGERLGWVGGAWTILCVGGVGWGWGWRGA